MIMTAVVTEFKLSVDGLLGFCTVGVFFLPHLDDVLVVDPLLKVF